MGMMKLSAFITYMILFFSMIFVLIILYFGINIILINIYKNNFFVLKNSAIFFSSVFNSLFSSSNNVTIRVIFPKAGLKIYIYRENITLKRGNEIFSANLFLPNYIFLENKEIETSEEYNTEILIVKLNDKVEII